MIERDDKLDRYFESVRRRTDELPEHRLDQMIRAGIEGGLRRNRRARTRYAAAAGLVLACLLLVFFSWIGGLRALPQTTSEPKSWGTLEAFRPIVNDEITLRSALDAGLVKPLHITTGDKNGYEITLDGVLADRKGLVLLYTFNNRNEEKAQISEFYIKNPTKEYFSSTYSSGDNAISGISRSIMRLYWDGSGELPGKLLVQATVTVSTPEAMQSSSDKYRTTLQAELPLDPGMIEKAGKEMVIDKALTVAGQRLILKKAYIGTTGIYLNAYSDGHNTQKILRIIDPAIRSGRGDDAVTLSSDTGMNISSPEQTFVFQNNNMAPGGPLVFTLKGIHALEMSRTELVIDTSAKKILKAPDDSITFEGMDSSHNLVLKQTVKVMQLPIGETGILELDDNFTDGEGSGHFLLNRRTESSGNGSEVTRKHYFNIGDEDLPQPLTFKITNYPSPIMEEHSLRFR